MIDGASIGVGERVCVCVFERLYTRRIILYYSEQLIEFITTPMGNAIPAGPVINSVSVWCAKRLRKQINPHANDAKERKKERKEGKKEPERERLRGVYMCVCV